MCVHMVFVTKCLATCRAGKDLSHCSHDHTANLSSLTNSRSSLFSSLFKTRKMQLLCVFHMVEEEPTLVGFIFSLIFDAPLIIFYRR
jgi:hypothetical protein